MSIRQLTWLAGAAVGLLLGCQAPPPAEAGRGLVWGKVELVPRDGVKPVRGASAIDSRRLSQVLFSARLAR